MPMIWSPSSPARLRRPTVFDLVDANLTEVGHKLALELQHIFHLPSHSSSSNNDIDDEVVAVEDVMSPSQSNEVNISSPLSGHFPYSTAFNSTATPGGYWSLSSTPHLSPSSSSESLQLPATSSSPEPIPDPFHVRGGSLSSEGDDDMDELRASSARAAFRLPPRPRFHEMDDGAARKRQRRARSSEEMSVSRSWSMEEPQVSSRSCLGSPIMDPWKLAFMDWKNSSPSPTSPKRTSSVASEKPLRSVRSFITPPSQNGSSISLSLSSPPSTRSSPLILSQKSLSSGIGLDDVDASVAERQPSPTPPQIRRLAPRRTSSTSSLV